MKKKLLLSAVITSILFWFLPANTMLQQALRYLYSPPEEEPEEEKEFDEPMQEISTLPVKKQKPKGEKEIILTEEEKEFDEPGKETYATPADITPMGGREGAANCVAK